MDANLIALHGFLGDASDWKLVFDSIRNPRLSPRGLDYARDEILNPRNLSFADWGNAFARWFEQTGQSAPVELIGYSQGGRLALQILQDHPELIRRLMLISCNPGFPGDKKIDREQRRRHDEIWAKRFESDDWHEVCVDWNAQPVFHGGAKEPVRTESAQAREIAAASLRNWSVAEQGDFRATVEKHAGQISWVVGDHDLRYRGIASELKTRAHDLDIQVVANSGHRVLFDNPLDLAALIDRFFEQELGSAVNP